MGKLWWEAEYWEWSENDAVKHHRKVLDHMIQAAEEAVEYAKINNLSRQEVIEAKKKRQKLFKPRPASTKFKKQAWMLKPA